MRAKGAVDPPAARENATVGAEPTSKRPKQATGPEAVGAARTPIAPPTPSSGPDSTVTMNPEHFAMELSMDEQRIRLEAQRESQERTNLLFGACVCVTIVCILAGLGAAVFFSQPDNFPAAIQTSVSTENYTTDIQQKAERLHVRFERDGSSETVIEGNATGPDAWMANRLEIV